MQQNDIIPIEGGVAPDQRAIPVRWYFVNRVGMATLCLGEADARDGASEADERFPQLAPHIATQLAPVEPVQSDPPTYYVSGPYPKDGAMAVCETATGRIVHKFWIGQRGRLADAIFWFRPRSDGGYEGPIHNDDIEAVRKRSGAWIPLFAGRIPVADEMLLLDALDMLQQLAACHDDPSCPAVKLAGDVVGRLRERLGDGPAL